MSKKKKETQNLQGYLYYKNPLSTYARVTNDLIKSKPFQDLPISLQKFYLVLIIHSFTEEQTKCLFKTLKDYHDMTGNEVSDFDLSVEVGTYRRSKNYGSKFFVFPQKHAEQYGYSSQYSSKCLAALCKHGFIKKYCFDKGHYKVGQDGAYTQDFFRLPTVYKFIDTWKR